MSPHVVENQVFTVSAQLQRDLVRALAVWYQRQQRNLPWRQTRDPYAIWVSEVMLQQTQVKTVLPYFERFMTRFPSPADLARAELPRVLKVWEGLGYYARARNLHKAAGIVAVQLDGCVPSRWDTLRALPGIGDYIAAAVLSIAFNRPYAVLDGNVKRVLARLFLIHTPVNQAAAHRRFQTLADSLLDRKHPGDHNQAMMELGATVCTPRHPRCPQCPVAQFCKALQTGNTDNYPHRLKKEPVPQVHLVAGLVWKKERVLLTRRPAQGLLGGLWEFVSGKLEPSRDPFARLAALIKQTVHLDVRVQRRVAVVQHAYTHFKIQMQVYECQWRNGRVRLHGPAQFAWIRLNQLNRYALHGAVHKAVEQFKTLYPPHA